MQAIFVGSYFWYSDDYNSLAEPTHYVAKRADYAPSYLLKDGWKTQNARATRISQNSISYFYKINHVCAMCVLSSLLLFHCNFTFMFSNV